MPTRKIVDVEPRPGGRWAAQSEGTKRAALVTDRKADALARAKEIAQNATLGQVRVKGENGRIQQEMTYGKDPRRTRG
jgi:hypothetical protein